MLQKLANLCDKYMSVSKQDDDKESEKDVLFLFKARYARYGSAGAHFLCLVRERNRKWDFHTRALPVRNAIEGPQGTERP